MNFILRAKHWQIFIVLFFSSFLTGYIYTGQPQLTLALNLIGTSLYMFYYFSLTMELFELIPPKIYLSKTMFIVNSLYVLLSFFGVQILFDGQYESNGIVGLIWALYLIYAMFQFYTSAGKLITTIEKEREVSFTEYIGTALFLIVWPIGIWFIQTRINNIYETRTTAINNG